MSVTRKQVLSAVNSYHYGLRAIITVQAIFLFLWSFSSIVEGMGDVMMNEDGFNAVSHLGFWLAIEIVALSVGYLSVNVKNLKFYPTVVVVAIIANVVHIVASILELVRCTSVLCIKNNGFLIAITVLFACLIVIECVMLYYVYKLNKYSKIKFRS